MKLSTFDCLFFLFILSGGITVTVSFNPTLAISLSLALISTSNVTQSGAVDVKNTILELFKLSVANSVILLFFAFNVQPDNQIAFYNNLGSKNSNYTQTHSISNAFSTDNTDFKAIK
jgi:hypothetical protein